MRYALAAALFGLLTFALAACAPETPEAPPLPVDTPVPPAAPPAAPVPGPKVEQEVVLQNIQFQPDRITVQQGATVTWTNQDAVPHTVTAGSPGSPTDRFGSGNMSGGDRFRYTFNEPGTYEYFCRFHGGMVATVVVE